MPPPGKGPGGRPSGNRFPDQFTVQEIARGMELLEMAFTVTGRRAGTAYQVAWDAGQLSGDPEAVRLVQQRAQKLEGRAVGREKDRQDARE